MSEETEVEKCMILWQNGNSHLCSVDAPSLELFRAR